MTVIQVRYITRLRRIQPKFFTQGHRPPLSAACRQSPARAGTSWSRYSSVRSRSASTLESLPRPHSWPVTRITPENAATATRGAGVPLDVEPFALRDQPGDLVLQGDPAPHVGGEQGGVDSIIWYVRIWRSTVMTSSIASPMLPQAQSTARRMASNGPRRAGGGAAPR